MEERVAYQRGQSPPGKRDESKSEPQEGIIEKDRLLARGTVNNLSDCDFFAKACE